jgi:type 1 fimbria pilin
MTNFKAVGASLIFGLGFIQAGYSQAAGTIYIREADVSRECSIPAVEGTYRIRQDTTCTNDQAYMTRFANVDSALTITYFNNGDCTKGQSWEIEVKTVKQPTSFPADHYISISAMAGVPDGSIIYPGLLKVRYRADGNIDGKLSCIYIERK